MKSKLAIIVIVMALCVLFAAIDYSHQPFSFTSPETSSPALRAELPDISFAELNTQTTYMLSSFKGKTIIINFWATWCAPCVHELPLLIELASDYSDDLTLILLSADRSDAHIYQFMQTFCLDSDYCEADDDAFQFNASNIYVARDDETRIARDIFQTTRYPESIVVDRDFTIKEKIAGIVTDDVLDRWRQNLDPK